VSESTTEMTGVMIDPVTGEIIDQKELAERLLMQAKEQGVSLVGPADC
jgi:putative transposase